MGHVFPEPRYAVPGVLAEGLNLLAGAPKLGKSWFALNVAAAVAYGGHALDKISVEQGEALYLALEDPPRRLQRRLRLILGGEPAPDGLYIETEWEQLLEGGCDHLDAWLGAHPDCRLAVVDVFAKVRGISNGNVNQYEADYAAMATLKTVADAHGVANLVVHHTRKASADDYVDSVSGTHGLAAAADAVLVLSRSRGSADAKLHVTGRDIEEAEYAMQFNPAEGSWALLEGTGGGVRAWGDAQADSCSPTGDRAGLAQDDRRGPPDRAQRSQTGLLAYGSRRSARNRRQRGLFLPVTCVTRVTATPEGDDGDGSDSGESDPAQDELDYYRSKLE